MMAGAECGEGLSAPARALWHYPQRYETAQPSALSQFEISG